MDSKLLEEIAKGKELHHTETVDKAAPKIEPGVTVKQNEHGKLLAEITSEHHLKHVDPSQVHDASAPNTEGAKVGQSKHADLLKEVKAKATSDN